MITYTWIKFLAIVFSAYVAGYFTKLAQMMNDEESEE